MGEFFQQFLNRVNRNYGQVDKNIFGGLLPGGAATPIGAALQGYIPPKDVKLPSPTTRRVASLLDAATGAIAGAQPFIEKTIKSSPDPVQGTIASGLNAFPFSVNLFGRYYTGLGDKNLRIPESATRGIKDVLDTSVANTEKRIKEAESELDSFSLMLQDAKAGKLAPPPGAPSGFFVPNAQRLNDVVAEAKSKLNKIKQGDIPFFGYNAVDNNPLTSPATSFGSVWFSPKKKGYTAKEKYDFVYSGLDAKSSIGPTRGPHLAPTQNLILNQLLETKNKPKAANFNQVTDFGRAIVGKMPDKSFEYLINIR